jgi:YVTN family beta-propeller protein
MTRDGRYAVVTGGDDTLAASGTPAAGMVYVIDLRTRHVAAKVAGVGINPYRVTVVEDAE